MSFKVCILSFILFVLCGINAAKAEALRCESVFVPTVMEVITQIDKDHNQFLLKGRSLEELTSDFSWLRKRKLRKILNSVEIEKFPSENAIDRYVAELGTVMFGSKDNVTLLFKKSKDERLEDSTVKIIQEKLLNDGLRGTWGDVANVRNTKLMQRMLDKIWTFQNGRIGQLTGLPLILPAMRDMEVPPELMYKIIRDGYKAHAEEARVALKKQSSIDAYNTFKKVYRPIAAVIMFTFMVHTGWENYHDMINKQVDSTMSQLQESRQALDKIASGDVKSEIYQAAVDGAIKDFVAKWGEQPTASERAQIEAKIQAGLKAQ
ncbi:hypothetical protein [Bdellovibrio sp. NC01]|uniref:hypothetical protein n=1 Tax=Bdellovibrio sp. NC01 TaxID=2220073 RepID=UPI00115B19A8|nr:hypothetical protein [Bdellovibrio sp. NC01]QDK38487.1 hypothetical protein DOE51_13315 [Bdellovibrio sp. NC01]